MLSVIIPAYNEEEAIFTVINSLHQALKPLGTYEIIVVDDGSEDKTGVLAQEAGAKVLRHPINIGYGNALKNGILEAHYPDIAILDADGTYPADHLLILYKEYCKGFDMVVGARTGSHYRESFLKNPARIAFTLLAEYVAGCHIPDINSGMRLFKRDRILPFLNDLCGTYSFTTSLTLICFRQSFFVKYIDIPYHQRLGTSKVRLLRDTLRAAQILTHTIITYNPLKLFLLIAAIQFLFSGLLFLLYALTVNKHWEWFVLALFFLGMAILSILIGFLTYASNQRLSHVWPVRYPSS